MCSNSKSLGTKISTGGAARSISQSQSRGHLYGGQFETTWLQIRATYDDNAHMHLGSSQIQEAQWGHIVTSSQPAVCDGQGLAGCQEDARGSQCRAIALVIFGGWKVRPRAA